MDRSAQDEAVVRLTRRLVDEGKLIEAGWAGFNLMMSPPDAPPYQVQALRRAFMSGAQHLWGSIFAALDEGDKVTDLDVNRLELIAAEMEAFRQEIKAAVERGHW